MELMVITDHRKVLGELRIHATRVVTFSTEKSKLRTPDV